MDTSKRLKKLEDVCKALKATYAVSGSMIEFVAQESQTFSDTINIPSGRGAAIDWFLRFAPNEQSDQARLTDLTMYYLIKVTQSNGSTFTAATGTKHGGDINDSGQIVVSTDLSFPGGGDVQFSKIEFTAHGVASGLVSGSFSFDHNVIYT